MKNKKPVSKKSKNRKQSNKKHLSVLFVLLFALLGAAYIQFSRAAQVEKLYYNVGKTLRSSNADGSSESIIGDNFASPSYKSDGSKFAYIAGVSGLNVSAIYTANSDGTGSVKITNPDNNIYDRSPKWSPSGDRIAFERFSAVDFSSTLMIVRPDGSDLKVISGNARKPSWRPDGQKITYEQQILVHQNALAMANGDGSGGAQYLINQTGTYPAYSSWSPDSKKMAIVLGGSENDLLYIFDVATGALTQITYPSQFEDANESVWSPDGQTILFSALKSGVYNLYSIKPDGSNFKLVRSGSSGNAASSPNWIRYTTPDPITGGGNGGGGTGSGGNNGGSTNGTGGSGTGQQTGTTRPRGGSGVSTSTPGATNDTTPPSPVIDASATSVGTSSSVEVAWSPSIDDISSVTYTIERSEDTTTWVVAADNLLSNNYLDESTVFAKTYYYRVTAKDAAGNVSVPGNVAEVTTINFTANAGIGSDLEITSSDGIFTVTIPQAALSAPAACSIQTSTSLGPVIDNLQMASGPYVLICKEESGLRVVTYLEELRGKFTLPKTLTDQYHSFAYYGDISGSWELQNKDLRTTGNVTTLSLGTQPALSFAVMGKLSGQSAVARIIAIVLILTGLIAGGWYLVQFLRKRHALQEQYDLYRQSKGY